MSGSGFSQTSYERTRDGERTVEENSDILKGEGWLVARKKKHAVWAEMKEGDFGTRQGVTPPIEL